MSIETMTAEEVAEGKLNEAEVVKEIMASGEDVGLRIWREEEPDADKEFHTNSYETVGYVLKGKAELHLENDQVVELTEGNSYLVPKETEHTYKIIETFSAVEATSPPAHLQ
ncbi:MAG: cupin domain-containing protein [Gracilimonas sp.]|uniref:cupin domain-containing protein n=1 Tax=Gracilimonas sp. TaxID=1974203 RepID=UPI001B01B5FD|nr:cupin domain-containing protein [Gracilimonas sp.]MBO6585100.1 cupin domain-containing protein [Gracilimonas sp.]MBO6615629.1 cupin domain-containing protein [Gracilimonas sp.]